MPKESTPAKVEPALLPPCPTMEELRANSDFQKWHKSPFLRMMVAALRSQFPMSGSIDPHGMIRDGGIGQGYMIALLSVDDFCKTKQEDPDKQKRPAYAGPSKED